MDDMETGSSVDVADLVGSAGAFQKAREEQYLDDPDDWATRWWYQTGIHLGMIYALGVAVLAVAELIHLSPAQVAYDYLEGPLNYYQFNTFFGLTPWLVIVAVGAWNAFSWFMTAMGRGCANRAAVKYNRTVAKGEKLTLPYPPLRLTGWWCFWNLVFWAGDIGYMARLYWIGTNNNIVQQAFWFTNVWWFTIICAMFTCLPGILHRFRHAADAWLFCCRSSWYDC